jgi:hypothetical protein
MTLQLTIRPEQSRTGVARDVDPGERSEASRRPTSAAEPQFASAIAASVCTTSSRPHTAGAPSLAIPASQML